VPLSVGVVVAVLAASLASAACGGGGGLRLTPDEAVDRARTLTAPASQVHAVVPSDDSDDVWLEGRQLPIPIRRDHPGPVWIVSFVLDGHASWVVVDDDSGEVVLGVDDVEGR
jgi:hypothetical protein